MNANKNRPTVLIDNQTKVQSFRSKQKQIFHPLIVPLKTSCFRMTAHCHMQMALTNSALICTYVPVRATKNLASMKSTKI